MLIIGQPYFFVPLWSIGLFRLFVTCVSLPVTIATTIVRMDVLLRGGIIEVFSLTCALVIPIELKEFSSR